MCFFLTIAVPSKHADQIAQVFADRFQSRPTCNASVLSALPQHYAGQLITRNGCSCDLYARPQTANSIDRAEHLRRKYEARGWSQAKIARAMEQAQSTTLQTPTSGLHADVIERIQTLCRSVGSIALRVHWYDGDVETELLSPTHAQPCNFTDLPARAQQLNEDQVLLAIAAQNEKRNR